MGVERSRRRRWAQLPIALLLLAIQHHAATGFVLSRRAPPPSRQRLAAAAASSAAPSTTDGSDDEPIYQGFWRDGLAKLQAAFPTSLEPIDDLPEELIRAECALPAKGGGKQGQQQAAPQAPQASQAPAGKTLVEVHAFRVPGVIRMARAAVLSTTPTTLPPQVLNFVIFPEPTLDVPIFGADLVQLPGGHLIVLDFQPVAPPLSPPSPLSSSFEQRLAALHAKYSAVLPNGGALPEKAQPFFSPSFLFTRLDAGAEGTRAVRTTVRAAYLDYLSLYLEMLQQASSSSSSLSIIQDPERAAAVKRGHVAYATYRAENDPARGMLARMFGPAWTERLIHEVLFDWAERRAE